MPWYLTVKFNITAVGYCPMVPKPPEDYSVVYQTMKTVQKIISKTRQDNAVITFDEAIYCKAKKKFGGDLAMSCQTQE